mmetsp:Transcript_1207/g.2885  ORF Transcript_1207/g.2885 Transcript_1207/m.2885 type:complete len:313 (-) Transcript_1207:306-1244(-)
MTWIASSPIPIRSSSSRDLLHSGHHDREKRRTGCFATMARKQSSDSRSQISCSLDERRAGGRRVFVVASSSSAFLRLSVFSRWILFHSSAFSALPLEAESSPSAPAFFSMSASLPSCCKEWVSSPPPMLTPSTKTLGTVRRPVICWSVDWMSCVFGRFVRSITRRVSDPSESPARDKASTAFLQYGQYGLEKTTTGCAPTTDLMQSSDTRSQATGSESPVVVVVVRGGGRIRAVRPSADANDPPDERLAAGAAAIAAAATAAAGQVFGVGAVHHPSGIDPVDAADQRELRGGLTMKKRFSFYQLVFFCETAG